MYKRLLVYFIVFSLKHVYAQPQLLKPNEFKNVLKDEWVSKITQDQEGFIWAATQNGLYKYTGKTFKTYRYNPLITNSLPGNWVKVIEQGQDGGFWVGTYGAGLAKFDENKGSFNKVQVKSKNTDLNFRIIHQIFTGAHGIMWVVAEKGLYRKTLSGSDFVLIKKISSSVSHTKTLNGTTLIAIDNTLFRYNAEKEVLEPVLHNVVIDEMNSIGKNEIIYKSGAELFFYNCVDAPVKIDLPNKDTLLFMSNVKDGQCIVVGAEGNYILHTGTKKFQPYGYNLKRFVNLGISALFIDKQGLLWIATHKGLFKENTFNRVFSNHLNLHARRIGVDSSHIYLSGFQGFFKMPKSNLSNYRQFLKGTRITSMCRTTKGFWLGGFLGGVYFIDKHNKIKTIGLGKTKKKVSKIFGIVEDLNGFLWISTWQGLYVVDDKGHVVNVYSLDELKEIKILKLIIDKHDNLWAITLGEGVFKIPNISGVEKNKKQINYKKYTHNKTDLNSINSDIVTDIHMNHKGTIWVGTEFGLNRYNEDKDNFQPLRVNGKIFDKKIMAIQTDKANRLWISTIKNGLYVYNEEKETLFNIKEEDGLISNACLYTSSAMYRDTIYFGTDEGVQIINAPQFMYPTVNRAPHFSKITVQGALPVSFRGVELLEKPIALNYNQNSFKINLEIADYRFPEKLNYYYKFDKSTNFWTQAETPTITFNNINYGSYKLLVKAAYQATDLAPVSSLAFKIKPPWYKTILAYVLFSMGVIAALFYFFQLRYTQKIAFNKLKAMEELDDLKSNLFTNISHELRTPLTLISGPIEQRLSKNDLRAEDREELNMVKQNTDRLLNLIDQLMELSLIEAGQVKLKIGQGNLGLVLSQLVAAFRFKANDKNIDIEATITGLDQCWFDKDIIEKIGTNVLSNAIKYAPKNSTVFFDAQCRNGHLLLSVINKNTHLKSDKLEKLFERFYQYNQASEGVGVGLALIKDLVALSNGSILANVLEDSKIQFSITLPINKTAFENFELVETENGHIVPHELNVNGKKLPTIVVIDDEADILSFVSSIFKDRYNVVKFSESEPALQFIRKQLPDLVISDVMMPGLNGLELCAQIKEDALTSHIPIIVLTAKVTQDQQCEGLKTGADAYVTKPFSPGILLLRAQKLIETRQRLKQHFKECPRLTQALEVTSEEAKFMARLKEVLDEHLVNPEFNAEMFRKHMHMGRTQLHRKLKAILGMTTSEFIKSQRLLLAKDIFKKQQDVTISEVAYLVGFNSVSYFIKCFKEVYNQTPSQYMERQCNTI